MIHSAFLASAAALAAGPAAAQVRIGLLVSAAVRDGRFRLLPEQRGHR